MLTWSVVALLAFGVYGQRALGMALIDPKRMSGQARSVLAMIPLSILCAVTALQTRSTEGELVADPRIGGIGLAALLSWKRAPMIVVVIGAARAPAALRSL